MTLGPYLRELVLLVHVVAPGFPGNVVIEQFPSVQACEAVRLAMQQQYATWYSTDVKPWNAALRCIPATVAR